MPSVNLAPGTQYVIAAQRRRRRLLMWSIVLVVALLGVWAVLFIYAWQLEQRKTALEDQLRGVQLEIAKLDEGARRVTLFEKRLVSLDNLLDLHVSWNVVLQDLEKLLPAGTVLTGFEVSSETGKLSVQGLTSNIDQVAETLASLVNTPTHSTVFSSGTLESIQREEQQQEEGETTVQYRFSMDLVFSPSLLYAGK